MDNITEIIKHFLPDKGIIKTDALKSGRINSTYKLTTNEGIFTLQKINKYVFKDPAKVMHNILGVTEHIKKKIISEGGDPYREVLNVCLTDDKKPYYLDKDGDYWRVYRYIDNASTYDMTDDPEKLYNAGYGFGKFQNYLSDFNADSLYETIPDFHNGISRFDDFSKAVENDVMQRAANCRNETDFLLSREEKFKKLTKMQLEGTLPARVTHNDTKVNNILIDDETKKALCVIDLDTVMPGLSVFDFGDAARFIANTASEEETDMTKVGIDLGKYAAFAKGFLTAAGNAFCDAEWDNMSLGALTIGLELGMRFLTDYLNGDKYFAVQKENQNLTRAQCQLTLVKSMEANFEKMQEIIEKCRE